MNVETMDFSHLPPVTHSNSRRSTQPQQKQPSLRSQENEERNERRRKYSNNRRKYLRDENVKLFARRLAPEARTLDMTIRRALDALKLMQNKRISQPWSLQEFAAVNFLTERKEETKKIAKYLTDEKNMPSVLSNLIVEYDIRSQTVLAHKKTCIWQHCMVIMTGMQALANVSLFVKQLRMNSRLLTEPMRQVHAWMLLEFQDRPEHTERYQKVLEVASKYKEFENTTVSYLQSSEDNHRICFYTEDDFRYSGSQLKKITIV